jgi:AcrR family transcriptional regulator
MTGPKNGRTGARTDNEGGSVDGRSARRGRNRDAVIDAAIALVEQGVEDPTVEQLTASSGLSARSIFRYFDGLDDLRRAVIRRYFEKARSVLEISNAGDGSLDDRIRRFVDSRIRFNEMISGPARTARQRVPFAPVIGEDIQEYRRALEVSVREHFAPELKTRSKTEAEDLTALIDVLVSFSAYEQLVSTHRRSRSQVKRAWVLGLELLLGA